MGLEAINFPSFMNYNVISISNKAQDLLSYSHYLVSNCDLG